MKWPIVLVKIAKLISTHAITVGTGDSKCGRGRRCAMSAVAQQSETYFNMAAKGQSNDLSTDAVREAVLADRDESQESEEIDEEESVNGESEEDVISEKIELCLQAFDSFDLPDVNMEMFKKCVRRQIEASYRVFQSPTDPLKILLNAPVNCGTILYDETKLWLDKIKFRLGGKVSIRRLINAKYFETYQKKLFWHFEVELYALGCKMLLITFPSLKIISAMRYHLQGWKLLLYYSLCCQECQKGQSGHTSRGECKMEELKL